MLEAEVSALQPLSPFSSAIPRPFSLLVLPCSQAPMHSAPKELDPFLRPMIWPSSTWLPSCSATYPIRSDPYIYRRLPISELLQPLSPQPLNPQLLSLHPPNPQPKLPSSLNRIVNAPAKPAALFLKRHYRISMISTLDGQLAEHVTPPNSQPSAVTNDGLCNPQAALPCRG